MRKCSIRPALTGRKPPLGARPFDSGRCIHGTSHLAQADNTTPAPTPTPIRARSAANAERVWNQLSQLSNNTNANAGNSATFGNAVRAAGGRSIGDAVNQQSRPREFVQSRPKELVRRMIAPQGTVAPRRDNFARLRAQDSTDRARTDVMRVQRGVDRRGRGGSARGGRGGGGRGRGGQSGPRRRGATGEEDDDERDDDWEEFTGNYQLLTSDDYIDHFASLEEAQSYARLQDFVDEYDEAVRFVAMGVEDVVEDLKGSVQHALSMVNTELEEFDPDIEQALEHMAAADEKARPRHEPDTFPTNEVTREDVGDVPIGASGMGNVVEDGLRYIGVREGHLYRDPTILARKLVDGEFVKFTGPWEKRDVLAIAENYAYSKDTPEGSPHCGFESPSEEAKEMLVKRLIRGQYQDPADDSLRGDLIKNVARIAGANASYPAAKKSALLKTIQSLLPAEGAGQQRVQAGR